MINVKAIHNLCDKYNFEEINSTADINFVGFILNDTFYTVARYSISDDGYFYIYDEAVTGYFIKKDKMTKCKTLKEFEKGLQRISELKKKFLIKEKISKIEKDFK